MNNTLQKLMDCIEAGKINKVSTYPPSLRGLDGADEFCRLAIEEGFNPQEILNKALIPGMSKIGDKFSQGKAFVPEMLISAKAMTAAMKHLKPFFNSGEIKRKGVFVIGTIFGDMHDIGKNLVSMMVEGAGWEVVDLGVDVSNEKFMEAAEKYPDSVIGISALLTTTMVNMEKVVRTIKDKYLEKKIIVGGAPLSADFSNMIGADFYSPDPQGAVDYLNKIKANYE